MTTVQIGDEIEVREEKGAGKFSDWYHATVTDLDGPFGFFISVNGPNGIVRGVWRNVQDKDRWWRVKPAPG